MPHSRSQYTPAERHIARQLCITDAGLDTLRRIARGDGVSGGGAGVKLRRDGFVSEFGQLTDRGRRTLQQARKLGY